MLAGLTVGAILLSLGVPGTILEGEPARRAEDALPQRGVVSIEVPPGASAAAIAEALVAANLITSTQRFETLVALLGYEEALAAGRYDFEPGLTTMEIVERLRGGLTSPLLVTIPEGLRLEEIAERVAASGVVTAEDFLAASRDPAVAAGTLAAERPLGTSLEGYPFPATYRLSLRADAAGLVRQMLERFDAQFDEERLRAVKEAGRTLHEVLTVASIVEREAVLADEQAIIASVFWNRLERGMRLQADPTVQYAIATVGGAGPDGSYWKRELSAADLAFDSPHNTYQRAGLPPTPIAAPGRGAIDAAIRPAETPFLFFVARGDGSHAFAETLAEHQRNVDRFQGSGP